MFLRPTFTVLMTPVLSLVAAQTELDLALSLRMVVVLLRHGARSPTVTFPTDPNRLHPWIGGYGALQPRGTEQVVKLGQSLRQRYGSLIPKDGLYSTENMFILSSVEERCIMSAHGLLAGFLEPPEGVIHIPLRWQPVAVNVLPESEDNILLQSAECSRVDAALKLLEEHPTVDFVGWKEQVSEQMTYVSQHAGKSIHSKLDLLKFYDALIVATYNGLEVPDWAGEIYPEKAITFFRKYMLQYTATPELKRLRGGIILTEFLRNMKAKRDGELRPDRSIFIYSAHDRTQTSLLDSIGVINQTSANPAFASTVAFELHQNQAVPNDLEVRMVYYNDASATVPRPLEIPGCSNPCPLKEFESVTQDLYVENFDDACSLATSRDIFFRVIIFSCIVLFLSTNIF